MIHSSLQFQHISTYLIDNGYGMNEYDWCLASKLINGKQHTNFWHFDDFLLTHGDPTINDELIEWFSAKYGKLSPLSINIGKVHDYLSIKLDFTVKGKFKVLMLYYVYRIIGEAPSQFEGTASTPAENRLFMYDKSSPHYQVPSHRFKVPLPLQARTYRSATCSQISQYPS